MLSPQLKGAVSCCSLQVACSVAVYVSLLCHVMLLNLHACTLLLNTYQMEFLAST